MYKNFAFSRILLISSLIFPLQLSLLSAVDKSGALDRPAFDFTKVAKKAVPAVVSIKVKSRIKQRLSPWGSNENFNDFF